MLHDKGITNVCYDRVGYLAGEFARKLITKMRESEKLTDEIRKEDETNILCIQVAGLCHDLGMLQHVASVY